MKTMHHLLRDALGASGLAAAGALLAVTVAAPAGAVPVTTYILESDAALPGLAAAAAANLTNGPGGNLLTEYQANDGLIFGNVNANRIDEIAATNAALLGTTVEALGKLDVVRTQGAVSGYDFESYDARVGAGALSIDCDNDKCSSFDWTFDNSLTTLADGWEIVKIGVKYGNLLAYFLVDGDGEGDAEAEDGAVSGHFDIFDFLPDAGNYLTADLPAETLIDGMFQINNYRIQGNPVGKTYVLNGLSHVDFFGTPGQPTTDLPEPGGLGLLGLGLIGLGALARRRRA